ncbi:MAG: CobD/CbiB family cobalamin biosynthesis protein, partial [Actinomycetota bacterium]
MRVRWLLVTSVAALLLAACGGGGGSEETTTDAGDSQMDHGMDSMNGEDNAVDFGLPGDPADADGPRSPGATGGIDEARARRVFAGAGRAVPTGVGHTARWPLMSDESASPPVGLALGWVADVMLGDPVRYHPVAGFGRVAEKLESVMWRPSRTFGAAYVVALVGPVVLSVALLDATVRRNRLSRLGLATVVGWTVLGGRSLGREAHRIAAAVARGDVAEARRIAPALVGRDPSGLDGPELCRAAVESVAENTADAVVAPLLWGAIAGPPGAVAYRAANTLDAMVGHHNDR